MTDRAKAFAIIAAAALATAIRAAWGSWHFDDFYTIVNNEALRDPSNILRAFTDPSLFSADPARSMYRPVLVVSFILNYVVLGESVAGFLGVNIALHVANSALVCLLASKLTKDDCSAFAAGLIYAVHPAATEGFAYASARSATLAVFFGLLALICYIRWDGGKSIASLIASLALFVLALGAKEIGILFIAGVVMYRVFFGSGRGVKSSVAGIAASIAIGAGYMMVRRSVMGVALAPSLVRPISENLLTQAVAMTHYFRLFLWPIHQSINPWHPVYTKLNTTTVASIALVTGVCLVGLYLGLRGSRRMKAAGFGILWTVAAFAPESTVVPLNLVIAERRMIQPLVGVALMFGAALGALAPSRRRVVVWALAASFAALSVVRIGQWKDEETAWRWASRVDPHWGLLLNNVGLIYLERPDTTRAMKMFELAARRDPSFKEARLNLGHVYATRGLYAEAMKSYSAALALDQGYAKAATSYARAARASGDTSGGRTFLVMYSKERPSADVYHALGDFFAEDGDLKTAVGYYIEAFNLNPLAHRSVFAACDIMLELGDRAGARTLLTEFLKSYPIVDGVAREAGSRLEALGR